MVRANPAKLLRTISPANVNPLTLASVYRYWSLVKGHILPAAIGACVEITLGPVWKVETALKPICPPYIVLFVSSDSATLTIQTYQGKDCVK
jgi:hypothetical protein